ncbi:MAG: hypothetical protein PF693_19670 [Spirochaetia bacterium]|jgi:hypothetical protein|nr:hypothetical protein [Spirochaetia bacterium]
MDIELKQETWYEITLAIGKKFTAFHKNGELIFTDGSTKYSGDILPYAASMVPCEAPNDVLQIIDFLPDLEEK